MKAIVYYNPGDIRLENVQDPKIEKPTDAIVRLTCSAICGTDLHFVRGSIHEMKPGTILGHEGVGIIEELGSDVRNFKEGDRVVIASTIACGNCVYCRAGYYSQCDVANHNGPQAGTAYFGGPMKSGPFHGLQAEKARIPFASVGLVRLPDEITDEQAITLSDIFPTGYFGAVLAEIKQGDSVAVFGCGPVGQFVIASAKHLGAGRIFAIDSVPSRLDMAREQGAEIINFKTEDPVKIIQRLTHKIGADRAIDAVGIDAERPQHERSAKSSSESESSSGSSKGAGEKNEGKKGAGQSGHAPIQVLKWAVESLAKAGSLSIVGVYPAHIMAFPIGMAMHKNLTIKMGNCNHRKYIPHLIELIKSRVIDPAKFVTQHEPMISAIEAYKAFDTHASGWMKVKLEV